MINIVSDINTLTTIPVLVLNRLVETETQCISHAVVEALLKDDIVTINIGIGSLTVGKDDQELKIKFTPSKALLNQIINGLEGNSTELTKVAEEILKDRILNTYKDLL